MRSKLTLDLNAVAVDSFPTTSTPIKPSTPQAPATCLFTQCGNIQCCA